MSTHPFTTTHKNMLETALPSRRAVSVAGLATLVDLRRRNPPRPQTGPHHPSAAPNLPRAQRSMAGPRMAAHAGNRPVLAALRHRSAPTSPRKPRPGRIHPGRDRGSSRHLGRGIPEHRGRRTGCPPHPLPVYQAFGEAGHLAIATGTATTGLALLGLASATGHSRFWSTSISRGTTAAGVLLILTAVVGPVSIPVYALWLLTISVLLLRWNGTKPNAAGQLP
jgi:hypothetical protein